MEERILKTVICTGISGTGVGAYLERVRARTDLKIEVFDLGSELSRSARQRGEQTDEESILNRPESALAALRDIAFERLMAQLPAIKEKGCDVLVLDAHALFPWKSGFLRGVDQRYLKELSVDCFFTIVAPLQQLLTSLWSRPGWKWIDPSTVLAWRQLEIVFTELLASLAEGSPRHFVLGSEKTEDAFVKLLGDPDQRRFYFSYPMTYAAGPQQIEAERVADRLARDFPVFRPETIGELPLSTELERAVTMIDSRPSYELGDANLSEADFVQYLVKATVDPVQRLYHQIREQTVWLDYKLIEQADAVVVFYPKVELEAVNPSGRVIPHARIQVKGDKKDSSSFMPLSPGVLSETIRAFTSEKQVYLIWSGDRPPSNFFDFHVTRWFKTTEACLDYLRRQDELGGRAVA